MKGIIDCYLEITDFFNNNGATSLFFIISIIYIVLLFCLYEYYFILLFIQNLFNLGIYYSHILYYILLVYFYLLSCWVEKKFLCQKTSNINRVLKSVRLSEIFFFLIWDVISQKAPFDLQSKGAKGL